MSDDDKKLKILNLIADDMRCDAEHYEGLPFTGKNVAEYFGKQGAAIAALANIISQLIKES